MHIGKEADIGAYHLQGYLLRQTTSERDLGIIVTNSLKTKEHTNRACGRATGMMCTIKRSFGTLSPQTFNILYKTHVRPRLEYGGVAAYPCTQAEKDKIERVQRRATRMVPELKKNKYDERLKALQLFSQKYRRVRGDLITIRKILRGDMGSELKTLLPLRDCSVRRGHFLTLLKQRSPKVPAIYRLSRRAVNDWNALPATVVEEVSDDKFKLKLDEHMEDRWRQ